MSVYPWTDKSARDEGSGFDTREADCGEAGKRYSRLWVSSPAFPRTDSGSDKRIGTAFHRGAVFRFNRHRAPAALPLKFRKDEGGSKRGNLVAAAPEFREARNVLAEAQRRESNIFSFARPC